MNFDLACELIAVEDIPTHPALNAAELPQVEGARFHMVKKAPSDTDGSNSTLGVGP
jgi:hypothetical protein